MEIVVEYVLLENFFLNFITLKTVALIIKEKCKLFWLSAFICACLTVVMPLLNLSTVGGVLYQAGMTILAVCISFSFKTLRKFFKLFSGCFLVTCLYGGGCFFFERLFGIMTTLVFLVVISLMFVIVQIFFKWREKKQRVENFCFDVEISIGEQSFKWKAFLDSGNLLFDPLTKKPVSLVNFRVFSKLFKDIGVEDILRRTEKLKQLKFAHYINFNTLNNSDKILVFQVDKLSVIGGVVQEKATLGLALKNFNNMFGSDIILHNCCA